VHRLHKQRATAAGHPRGDHWKASVEPARKLRQGPLEVDLDRWQLTVAGRAVSISAMQFKLLAHLMRRPGRVFTREELLDAVWGSAASDKDPQVVDVLVSRLRKRLGADQRVIVTVRAVGYRVGD
jgi:two-component system, OmpR family, response regulator